MEPTPTTIPAALADAARRHGDACAIVDTSGSLTYAELATAVAEVAQAAAASGIRPNDRVAIWAPNSARWIILALGLLTAGAVLVPINTRYRGPEAADILARSHCRALFTVGTFLGNDYLRMLAESAVALPDLTLTLLLDDQDAWQSWLAASAPLGRKEVDTGAETVCDIIFTSGTTGQPKGVQATHGQTIAVYRRWSEVIGLRAGDRYLLVNPFSHTFGYKAGIVASVLRGVTMVPVPVFDVPLITDLIEQLGITVLTGPPTVFADLLDRAEPDRMRSLRLVGTGGTTVPVEFVRRIRREWAVPAVFTAYGLTESIGVVSVCPPDSADELVAETAGVALPGTEIRIGGNGEILARGVNVMHGYVDDPDATRAAIDPDGWLHTGDIGTLDDAGYLRIIDRLKDVIMVGGFNVYPAEVERIIAGHPGIREAAVVGAADSRLGEVVQAFVVPGAAVDEAAIVAWARERMAGYKIPRTVTFLDTLPRNASGKVSKDLLGAKTPPSSSTR